MSVQIDVITSLRLVHPNEEGAIVGLRIDVNNLEFLGWVLIAPVLSFWTDTLRAEWFIAYSCCVLAQLSIRKSWGVRDAVLWRKLILLGVGFLNIVLLISAVSRYRFLL